MLNRDSVLVLDLDWVLVLGLELVLVSHSGRVCVCALGEDMILVSDPKACPFMVK